jgi:hypothetical protein
MAVGNAHQVLNSIDSDTVQHALLAPDDSEEETDSHRPCTDDEDEHPFSRQDGSHPA